MSQRARHPRARKPPSRGFQAPSPLTRVESTKLAQTIVRWFEAVGADLPWRRTRDPYRIWVAEVLLQQTRVAQALPYYGRFLQQFPTLRALARAPLANVLKAWQGAGYYARARNLHRASREIQARKRGEIPRTPEELQELPGFGPYLSHSVPALAHGYPTVALDVNVRRVLSRITLRPLNLTRSAEPWVRALAKGVPSRPLNEGLMEIGQHFCRPRHPACAACPVHRLCGRYLLGRDPPGLFAGPRAMERPRIQATAGILVNEGRVLMHRRPVNGLLGGLWEFPGGESRDGEGPEAALRREFLEGAGLRIHVEEELTSVEHDYSHFHVTTHVYRARRADAFLPRRKPSWRWVQQGEFEDIPFPGVTRKIIPTVLPLLRSGNGRAPRLPSRGKRRPSARLRRSLR